MEHSATDRSNDSPMWPGMTAPLYWLVIALLAATLISTFYSCIVYLHKATKVLRS